MFPSCSSLTKGSPTKAKIQTSRGIFEVVWILIQMVSTQESQCEVYFTRFHSTFWPGKLELCIYKLIQMLIPSDYFWLKVGENDLQ